MSRRTSVWLIAAAVVVWGCAPVDAAPQATYRPFSGPWRPVVVAEATPMPSAAPRASYAPTERPAATSRPTAPPPTPRPTAKPTPKPRQVAPRASGRVVSGVASRMGPAFPSSYLALPRGAGITVRICGAGGCVTMRSTDAGPDLAMQRAGRVADLSDAVWQAVCGLPLSAGLCKVAVTY